MDPVPWSQPPQLDPTLLAQLQQVFDERLAAARAAVSGGDAARAVVAVEALLDHAVEQFCREEQWMHALEFPLARAHALQHEVVVQLLCEALRLARLEAQAEPLRSVVHGLVDWRTEHAAAMDGPLAGHVQRVAGGEGMRRRAG